MSASPEDEADSRQHRRPGPYLGGPLAVDAACGHRRRRGEFTGVNEAAGTAGHGLVDAVGFSLSEPVLDVVDVAERGLGGG